MKLLYRLLFLELIFIPPLFVFFVGYAGLGGTVVISQYAKALVMGILGLPLLAALAVRVRRLRLLGWLLGVWLLYRIAYGTGSLEYVLPTVVGMASLFFLLTADAASRLHGKVLFLLAVTALLAAVYNILQYLGLDFLHLFSGKMVSTFGNPNLFSQFATVVFFLVAMQDSLFYRITGVLLAIALVLTGTRAAMLALLLVGGYLVLARLKSRKQVLLFGVIILLVLLFGGRELKTLIHIQPKQNFRLNVYKSALDLVLANPKRLLVGYGTDKFEKYYAMNVSKGVWHSAGNVRIGNVHNEYISFLFENGLIATALFWALLVAILVRVGGAQYKPALFAFLFLWLFSFPFHVPANILLFFVVLGLITAAQQANNFIQRQAAGASTRRFSLAMQYTLLIMALGLGVLFAQRYSMEYYNKLGNLMRDRGYDAIAVRLLKRAKFNPKAMYSVGFILAQHSEFQKGKGYVLKNLRAYPYDYLTLGELGFINYNLKRYIVSRHYYEQSVTHNPYYTKGWENLVLLLQKQERYTKALQAAYRAFVLTGDWRFFSYMGDAYYALGQYEAAYSKHLLASRFWQDARAFNNVGVDLVRLGRLKESLKYFDYALHLEPGHPQALQNKENVEKYLRTLSK